MEKRDKFIYRYKLDLNRAWQPRSSTQNEGRKIALHDVGGVERAGDRRSEAKANFAAHQAARGVKPELVVFGNLRRGADKQCSASRLLRGCYHIDQRR